YDHTATHFLIRSVESKEWLATLRLIIAPFESLPINRVCEIYRDELRELRNGKVIEVSRLCAVTPQEKLTFGAGSATPWIMIGLIRGASAYALQHGLRYSFFLIADSLARLLKRVGIEFMPIGPV